MVATFQDKKTESAVAISQAVGQTEGNAKLPQRTRKYVFFAAIITVVIIALVVTAIVLGIKLSRHEINKYTVEYRTGKTSVGKEDYSVDMTDNVVQCHFKGDAYEVWALEDFNRDLQIMKVAQAATVTCFMKPLNRSNSPTPEKLKHVHSSIVYKDTKTIRKRHYEISPHPIKEKSMLGTRGEKLCDDLDVYWIAKTCDQPEEETHSSERPGRQKRTTWCLLWCNK